MIQGVARRQPPAVGSSQHEMSKPKEGYFGKGRSLCTIAYIYGLEGPKLSAGDDEQQVGIQFEYALNPVRLDGPPAAFECNGCCNFIRWYSCIDDKGSRSEKINDRQSQDTRKGHLMRSVSSLYLGDSKIYSGGPHFATFPIAILCRGWAAKDLEIGRRTTNST
jgi:hypothetical protein